MNTNIRGENQFIDQNEKAEMSVSPVSLTDQIVETADCCDENKEARKGNTRVDDKVNIHIEKGNKRATDVKVINSSRNRRRGTDSSIFTKLSSATQTNKNQKSIMNDDGEDQDKDDNNFVEDDICDEHENRGKARSTSLLKRIAHWFTSDKTNAEEHEKKMKKKKITSRSPSTSNKDVTNTAKESKSEAHRKTFCNSKQINFNDISEDDVHNNDQLNYNNNSVAGNTTINDDHGSQYVDNQQRSESAYANDNMQPHKTKKKKVKRNIFSRRRSTNPSIIKSFNDKTNMANSEVNKQSNCNGDGDDNYITDNNNNIMQKSEHNVQYEEEFIVENSPVNMEIEEDADENMDDLRSPNECSDDTKENTLPYAEEEKEDVYEEENSQWKELQPEEKLCKPVHEQQEEEEVEQLKEDLHNHDNLYNKNKSINNNKKNVVATNTTHYASNNIENDYMTESHDDNQSYDKSDPSTLNVRDADKEYETHEAKFDIYELLIEYDTSTHGSIESAKRKKGANKISMSADNTSNKSRKSGNSSHKQSDEKSNDNNNVNKNDEDKTSALNNNILNKGKDSSNTEAKHNVTNESDKELAKTLNKAKEQENTHKKEEQQQEQQEQENFHDKNAFDKNRENGSNDDNNNNNDACTPFNNEMLERYKSDVLRANENTNNSSIKNQNNACMDMTSKSSKIKQKYVQDAQNVYAVQALEQNQQSEQYHCQQRQLEREQEQQEQQQLCMMYAMNANANANANANMMRPNYNNINMNNNVQPDNMNYLNNMSQSYTQPFLPWNGPNRQMFFMPDPSVNTLQPIIDTNKYFFNAGYEAKRQELLNQIMSARQEQQYFNILRDSQVNRKGMSKDIDERSNNTQSYFNSTDKNKENIEIIRHE